MIEPIAQAELERAREVLAHRIAAGVHSMLSANRMTVAELKEKLRALPSEANRQDIPLLVDAVLRAEDSHRITISFLSDIAYVLGFEWNFKIERLPEPPEHQAQQ